MSEFTVTGRFESRDGWSPFEKTIEAPNENVARDRIYAEIGSEHGLKRTQIEVDETSEVAAA
jgi:large subunit ribosomal protein LX